HQKVQLIDFFRDRPPLFIFAGDVGTGKTALAETFGDAVAREADLRITLYALSLNARGTGAVGEMTGLLSKAFDEVKQAAKRSVGHSGKHRSGIVLLIDEADALAQSRELGQMHHEDRAGVNALIRGVDDLATGNVPAIVIMCTNRLEALDPAVRRRAAATFTFTRPNEAQRSAFLTPVLGRMPWTSFTPPFFCASVAMLRRIIWRVSLGSFNSPASRCSTRLRKLPESMNSPLVFLAKMNASGDDFRDSCFHNQRDRRPIFSEGNRPQRSFRFSQGRILPR